MVTVEKTSEKIVIAQDHQIYPVRKQMVSFPLSALGNFFYLPTTWQCKIFAGL